ncbi:MAG: ComEC/Rec2 family competence protein [Pseudomonadota bacterium]
MRLAWWCGAFVAGVAAALALDVPARAIVWLAFVPALCAFLLAGTGHRALAEGIVACAIGAYAGARAAEPRALPEVVAAALDTERRAVVEGWVVSAPESADRGSRLRVAVARVDGVAARAAVGVAVAEGVPTVLPGDGVRFAARLRSVRGLRNPGVADASLQARASGVDLLAGVGAAAAVARLRDDQVDFRPPAWTVWFRWAACARSRLAVAIDRVVDGSAGVLLHTAVLGERQRNEAVVEDGFRAAGATHVLSVSGLHLAAVALVFFAGVRRLLVAVPRLPLWLSPRGLAAGIALPAITFYTMVTGSAIATVRSALMMGFALVGLALGRPAAPVGAIAGAVLCLLAWSPLVVADVSFQLSVVSVLALAVLVPRLTPGRGTSGRTRTAGRAPRPGAPGTANERAWRERAGPALRWMGRFGAATLAAGATTGPLVAHHFGEVTPASPIGNALLVPLVELVVVPCGLGGAVLGAALGDAFGWPLLTAAGWGARVALGIAESFRVHAPVWLTRSPNGFETAALTIGVACALGAVGRTPRAEGSTFFSGGRWRVPTAGAAVVWLAAGLGSMTAREIARRFGSDVVVTFLDVGQGDAAVVQLPEGRTVLIDGGGTYDGSFDPGSRVVEPFLRARGITRLDAVALSHPHPDHLGGLTRIMARFPVGRLWTSGDDGHNPAYVRLVADARARGVGTPVPAAWRVGATVIDPLGPYVAGRGGGQDGEHIGPPEGTTVNDASLVLRIVFAGRAVLFTGDIEANGEGELRGRTTVGQEVASDVLKVPHHGSRTSSGDELLDVVRPRLAVMSLGWKNRFHFPRPEVVARYRARGIRLLRTDVNGAVTVTIGQGGAMTVWCARGC